MERMSSRMRIIEENGQRRFCGTYCVAGHVFSVESCFARVQWMCEAYACDESPEFSIRTTREDIRREQEFVDRENSLERLPPNKMPDALLEATAVYRKLTENFVEKGIFLFHGSAVAVDGEAYLFTAKSGTGKSTHTRLWRELFGERAVMVNDDKPLIEPKEDVAFVHGTPWNGKHNLGENITVPLKAICILERGEKNRIERIHPAEAFPVLWQQTNRASGTEIALQLLEKTVATVPIYRLQCNMNPEAAQIAYDAMK